MSAESVLAYINRRATRVRVQCADGTDHTTYYDPPPTKTTLGHLLLDAVNSDRALCGPHLVLVDTVVREEVPS